jgi:hypothetical protein
MKKNNYDIRIGDCTSLGIVENVSGISLNYSFSVTFDRKDGDDSSRLDKTPSGFTYFHLTMNSFINWSRFERLLTNLIEKRKIRSTIPVYKNMLKYLALLWECNSDEAYKRSHNIEELESALQRVKLKIKTVSRKLTDSKYGV